MGAFKDNPDLARQAGRKSSRKGSPNKATADLREFVSEALEATKAQILKDLADMEGRDRVNAWLKLAEFVLPKLTRTQSEISGIDGAPITVAAIRFIDDSSDPDALNDIPQPTRPIQAAQVVQQAIPEQVQYIIAPIEDGAPQKPKAQEQINAGDVTAWG